MVTYPSGTHLFNSIEIVPNDQQTLSLRCGPWSRHIYPSLVLVQPWKVRPCLTERLLIGRKESNQTNKPTNQQTLWTKNVKIGRKPTNRTSIKTSLNSFKNKVPISLALASKQTAGTEEGPLGPNRYTVPEYSFSRVKSKTSNNTNKDQLKISHNTQINPLKQDKRAQS